MQVFTRKIKGSNLITLEGTGHELHVMIEINN